MKTKLDCSRYIEKWFYNSQVYYSQWRLKIWKPFISTIKKAVTFAALSCICEKITEATTQKRKNCSNIHGKEQFTCFLWNEGYVWCCKLTIFDSIGQDRIKLSIDDLFIFAIIIDNQVAVDQTMRNESSATLKCNHQMKTNWGALPPSSVSVSADLHNGSPRTPQHGLMVKLHDLWTLGLHFSANNNLNTNNNCMN